MPSCKNCGTTVSERYARVFGDNTDDVHRCRECASYTYVTEGAGAGLDPDSPDHRPDGPNQRGPRDHHDRALADGGRLDEGGDA